VIRELLAKGIYNNKTSMEGQPWIWLMKKKLMVLWLICSDKFRTTSGQQKQHLLITPLSVVYDCKQINLVTVSYVCATGSVAVWILQRSEFV
jgi:hypothetical protein